MTLKSTLFFLLFVLVGLSHAQTFRFNQYTMEDGLPQNFIYSIDQDEGGYLWVGTGEGLGKFDGKNFLTYTTNQGLAEDIITCSYVDEKGILWLGHNSGTLSRFNHKEFKTYTNSTVAQSTVNAIVGFGNDVYFITQNEGLFHLDEKAVSLGKFEAESFHSMAIFDENNIILGTSEGLLHLEKSDYEWKKVAIYLEDEWVSAISSSKETGVVLVGTQSGTLAKCRLQQKELQFSKWDGNFDFSSVNIKTIMQDDNLNIWLGTYGQGLIKLHVDSVGLLMDEYTTYNENTGLSSNYIQSVFQDREGNIWIGTFGKGLSTLIDDFFTFYSHKSSNYGNSVSAIWVTENDKWYGVENGLIRISTTLSDSWTFYSDSNDFVQDRVTALHYSDSSMWIGTDNHGLYQFDYRTESMQKVNWYQGSLENRINEISSDKSLIWVATDGGLITYNPELSTREIFNTEAGLHHNAIKTVLQKDDKIWMGTHSRYLFALGNSQIEEFEITAAGDLEIIDMTSGPNNSIWMATNQMGVYVYEDDGFRSFSIKEGLKSNYCYAIQSDGAGNIWVGHRGGLSKINPQTKRVHIFDHTSGIEDQVNTRSIFLDEKRYLWIGTDGGAIKYDPTKDRVNSTPPVTNLLRVIIDDKEYGIDEAIHLPYGNYRVQFEFIGISFSNPDEVSYQFKLEGHDGVYSNPSKETQATYGRLADGTYRFKVKACNEDGICSETTAEIDLVISAPFWKTWWFRLLLFFVFIAGMVLFIQIRTRRYKAIQRYLKTQLDLKTKEVVEKANEIALINKNLTASINYAERIQQSILPNVSDLTDVLPHSFIFFKPRDIVSGDFYYIERIQNKLIVVCSDCTGHGVPGAFMSMIGSVAIRNIYEIMKITGEWKTPEKVLENLDAEVEVVLKQKSIYHMDPEEAFFQSKDGMDLTICEINLDSREVLLSSALRTSLIQQNGKVEMVSGTRRPIGGGKSGGIDFELQQFQMEKGDALYLFSDGYSDQFGGPNRRKLKLTGVQKIVEKLENTPPDDYASLIEKEFDDWKGDVNQIDDVLFMGLIF
jgi:ligand-binding sensor domain-containing protein/serine phosphatase RsbU (regulator of sigma subunit)